MRSRPPAKTPTVRRAGPRLRLRPRCWWAALVAPMLVLAACGSEEPEQAQPAPEVTTFEAGRFDDLPHPPKSDPVGSRTDLPEAVTRSYRVVGMGPRQVLEFYAGALEARGWQPTEQLEQPGAGTYRRTWASGEYELTVSSSPATTLGTDDPAAQVETQYSLSLRLP